MSDAKTKPEKLDGTFAADMDEAFEGFVAALGILPPETLRDPDGWLSLSETGSLQAIWGNLARVPVLSEHW